MGRRDTSMQHMGSAFALPHDYQRFLQLGSRRAPQALYMHERDYRSTTLNTDALGMRYSHFAGKRHSLAERGGATRVNLLVGGSCALGIGASGDEQTVASCLSALTGEVWLTLAGCGLNATQELLLFLTHQHRLDQIGHVVVLSGLNTLAQDTLGDLLAGSPDPHRAEAYQAFLNRFNEGVSSSAERHTASLWRRLAHALAARPTQPWPALEALPAAEQRLARAADCIGRTLGQWERVLANTHTSLTFILQPLLPWCRDALPAGEQRMLEGLYQQPSNLDRLLDATFERHLHPAFFRRLKRHADPVPCYDMNSMLSSSPVFDEHLFIDRLHFNDLGHNALAKVITAKLGLAQDRQTAPRATPTRLV